MLLWIPKQIVDGIIAISRHNGDARRIWYLVLLELSLGVIAELLLHGNNILDGLLGEHLNCYVGSRLIEHAASLDLSSFEDPLFYDKLDRARGQATGRAVLLVAVLAAAQELATLVTLSIGVIVFSPWLMVLLAVATMPTFIGDASFSRLSCSLFFRRTPERRELEYLQLLGSSIQSAKEVKIFGLGSHLSARYRLLSERIYNENRSLAIKRGISGWLMAVLASLGYYGGYVIILTAAISGRISIGVFTFLIGAFARSRMSTEHIFSQLNSITEQSVLLKDLFDFFEVVPAIRSSPNALALPRPIREGFEFRNVSFSYPGSTELVLRNVSLRIGACERVAFIGENGSGKTTIVKLLARLYDPVCGQILLDGVDLRDYDLVELRSAVSVVFQDFVRYDLTVRDNVGFGDLPSRVADRHLEAAVQKSGARTLIEKLPLRYDQILGRRFKDGIDLSGGEWQKVALARMFARDAQLFILDEPTASLDVRAERDFFERLGNVLKDRTAVMISHRLSTIRTVDKIVVLDKGEVLEEGTHEKLISLEGRYADLFRLEVSTLSVGAAR